MTQKKFNFPLFYLAKEEIKQKTDPKNTRFWIFPAKFVVLYPSKFYRHIPNLFYLIHKKNLLTDDNDFHSNDDKYSILCSTRETYDSPRKTEDWPSCVKFCPRELIYVPKNNTGLTGIVAKNTIPTGQYGSYVCIDQTLGVNRVWCILFKSKPLICQITKQHLKWWKNNNQIHF